ncbi:aspartyl/asparaginyl beta-hydroxylase domain-containing protein [Algicella marina]|uniref:Aspartyl/asparaginyl beta-hydroxylase domain-containing protein n=1 Tax=Algicella marina TaxID=2683284 RepID=A0A6P1SWN4_9RHOB|nr:aspartyl/asparaginyl beta-hydroxylase domain-containing protein [Algicella marina]QHQ34848.1 aspartyl/asparaginyl beta-hydroxylase domain-containing protein [Algicella marina]
MDIQQKVRKAIKWGPWGYRFWREAIRMPYEAAFKTPAVVDVAEHFPAAKVLTDRYPEFRREALAITTGRELPANHEIMPHQKTFFEHDHIPWKMVTLRAYGYDYPENQKQMPLMEDFLKQHPDVVSATISVFPPGKHLRPHRGPFKGVWRYHLAYLVEELENGVTAAELVIDGETYHLKEGDDLLWDDTFMHEAINRSENPRIVLLLDVFRGDHPWWLGWLSRYILFLASMGQRFKGMRKRATVGG